MKRLVCFITLIFCGIQAFAQPADHVRMELGFQDSLLEVKAWYATRIQETSNKALFILNPGFDILEIRSSKLDSFALGPIEGRPFPFWKLYFRDSLEQNEDREFFFHYTIDLREQNHLKSDWVELNVDKLWFPKFGDLDTQLTYDLTIRNFPGDFDLVSHVGSDISRGQGVIHLKSTRPEDEVLILAGRNMEHRPFDDSITFFVNREVPEAVTQSLGEKVDKTIQFLNDYFGRPRPIDTFKVVIRNCPREEIGFQFSRGSMIITGTDFDDYGNLAHEIAHFWWTGADFIKEPWMNEAFANYSMLLVLDYFDEESAQRLTERYTRQSKEAGAVGAATLFSEDAHLTYYVKGTLLLRQLETYIGKDKMRELLEYRVANDIKTTKGFLQAVEKIAGPATRDFFQNLLLEKG